MPLVSIGLPVFNGENGISCALDSLINQDYKNLEIIISDNASTDATKEICACYVKKDSRVKYFRIENNLGAVWNFNRVFELAKGDYFMWAAHDDNREPTFISACVEKLQISPRAVLCQVKTAIYIDGSDEIMCFNDLDSFEGKIEIIERYRETLKNFPMTALYGLYRVTALKRTQRFSKSIATDVAFIQELSIHGNFIQVPSVLFSYIGRAKWNTIQEDYKAISGGALKPWWYLPFIVYCIIL
jgi:glycosyltransferase involved in cell wall biosynthesis